jgi:HTH-type transcriptional regulator/antitoxin HigA
MGRPVQAINEIVKGKKEITPETALQLERVLGVPAHIWLGLESTYRQALARRADRRTLADEAESAGSFPYWAMARLRWVPKVRDPRERAANLLRFFGVTSLEKVPTVALSAAYRLASVHRVGGSEPFVGALAAWLRRGEIESLSVETRAFDQDHLRATLPTLRRLTTDFQGDWVGRLRRQLSDCGVAVVFIPHLPGTRAHGAARWLSPKKAVVQISIRGRWADVFWFSLFHELGHVLLHGRRDLFIEWDDGARDGREAEADAFARETLIPSNFVEAFVQRNRRPSGPSIVRFAESVGVHPGIVVGRLHHEGIVPHSHFNRLRHRLAWAADDAGARDAGEGL